MISLHRRGERSPILTERDRRVDHRRTEGMREINERSRWQAAQQTRRRVHFNLIPAHMGGLDLRRKALALPVEYAQAARRQRFFAARKHPLHPDANPQEWNPSTDRLGDGLLQTVSLQRLR